MAIQLTKIKADGGVNYLLNTIANDQPGLDFEAGTTPQPGSTRMDYYTAAGTPPGVWMGQGCAALGVKAGTRASRNQVVNLYSKLHHPITGSELTKRSDAARTNSVSGYDLTFEAPKSVSLLWALGDDHTRRTVLACHYEAIERTLDWWQREVAVTRVGAGGIAHSPVEGITAVRFDHWDTREHDPHLHSHVAISNLALREDGQWATLDGRVVYRAQVAASETHANILRDLLHDRLGVAFEEHPNEGRSNSKAVVLDVAGIPKELIDRFSKRSIQTDRIHRELLDRWRKEHGREPDYRTQARLREQAFQRGRKAKDTHALSLAELSRQWHEECAELGFDPAAICEQSLAHDECAVNANDSANTHELARQITGQQSWQAAISEITRNATSNATTISRWQLHAEIERLTSRIRCIPETRAHLTEQLVELATRDLIPINPHRYQIPEHHVHDTRIADTLGHANVDNARLDRWATRHLLDAEEYLKSLAAEQGTHPDPRLNAMVSEAIGLHEQRTVEAGGHRMADDQRQAATRLACSTATISALTGPAGTGKTTTMRAVKEALDNTLGPGKVMGMATGAKAAGELAASLDIATNTVAKILYEHCDSDGYYIRRRAKLIAELSAKPALSGKQRAWMNQLISEQQAVAIPEQGVVIVDEASMTSTMDLTRLAQLCARHGSRMILTGDPHQLDAPGEGGGFLGWMEDEHLDHRLTSVWRFNNPEETVATLALRDGRSDPGTHGRDAVPAATGMYMRLDGPEHPWENTDPNHCGRLHGGDSDDMEAAVYQHTLDGLLNGRDTLMIVATNDSLDRINARMSLELQARGLVDPDPAWR
ncbi:MAG: MobF family relaxase, partial [Bifidobacterium mongoliense]